jgi:23S rRNA pseudouridine955/2504/2580 synthase
LLVRTVSADQAGQRLDKYLRRLLPSVPKSHLYKMIRTRKVRVNGKRVYAETLLASGDEVSVRADEARLLAPAKEGSTAPVGQRLSILYEDDHLIAVNKPSGLAVHPGSGILGPTLVELSRAHAGVRPTGEFQASPAHRLDRDTSGIVLVAKSRRAMVRLTEMFTAGEVKKEYLALVKGHLPQQRGTVDLPLAEHEQTAKSRSERGVKLQEAITHYRVIAKGSEVSLLSCSIETGRTHQIRRHLAAIGHPVLGDRRHGDFVLNRRLKPQTGLTRLFLHARKLGFAHPISGKPLMLESSLPSDLQEVLRRLDIPGADKLSDRFASLVSRPQTPR